MQSINIQNHKKSDFKVVNRKIRVQSIFYLEIIPELNSIKSASQIRPKKTFQVNVLEKPTFSPKLLTTKSTENIKFFKTFDLRMEYPELELQNTPKIKTRKMLLIRNCNIPSKFSVPSLPHSKISLQNWFDEIENDEEKKLNNLLQELHSHFS